MESTNLLLIMSDEHNPKVAGRAGDPVARTPNLDRLTARGTVFTSAYTNCPVCVPARASFATGKYVHQIGFWDNATPYDGSVESWHHCVRGSGRSAVSIGKLHFRSANEDHGFTEEKIPMNVIEEKGDLLGLVRDELVVRKGAWKMAGMAGPGESSYTRYDKEICRQAKQWLADKAKQPDELPWVLFVSFVAPHFPLIAPEPLFNLYFDNPRLPLPKLYAPRQRPRHSYLAEYGACFAYDSHFATENDVRRAIAGYYGLVSFLDGNIGALLETLERTGLASTTRVIYTSDHGDNLGARGLWGKSTMYEESVGVPLILQGPGVPVGKVVDTPVSLVDLHPTITHCVGLPQASADSALPGVSLFTTIASPPARRIVFAEYHAMGSRSAFFMVRDHRYKYVHYLDHPPQLFDLLEDPEEIVDLAPLRSSKPIIDRLHAALLSICDPVETDQRAKARQSELIALNGGRDAVIARGDLGFSPPPGEPSNFQ